METKFFSYMCYGDPRQNRISLKKFDSFHGVNEMINVNEKIVIIEII